MDYVTHLKPDGTYQPLREHEENVAALAGEFAAAFGAQERGYTPKAKMSKGCNACSLKALCLPKLSKSMSVDDYLRQAAKEADVS